MVEAGAESREEDDPLSAERSSFVHVAIGALGIVLLCLTSLAFLQAAAYMPLAGATIFVAVIVLFVMVFTLAIPRQAILDEPNNRLKRLENWENVSLIALFSAFIIQLIVWVIVGAGLLDRFVGEVLALFLSVMVLVFPWRTAEWIAKGSEGENRLRSSTISALLYRNLYFCTLSSMTAGLAVAMTGAHALQVFGILFANYLQMTASFTLLFLSPFFLMFLTLVELPGMVAIAAEKTERRRRAERTIGELRGRQDLTTRDVLELQQASSELVLVELLPDTPFPLLAKIFGGGLVVLLISAVLSLLS